MGFSRFQDVSKNEVAQSFISKLYGSIAKDLPFAEPTIASRTNESELVQGVLQMLQGFSSSLFYWDDSTESFCVKNGIYVSHLSQTSLGDILSQFVFGARCFKLVDRFVKKVYTSNLGAPTLKAFANSISLWLKRLRNVALKEEMKSAGPDSGVSSTLLGLTNSLSSICSGAEHLLQIVYGAIPSSYFDSESSISSGEMAVHILDHLCKKLNESCLVQGGEEEGYHMLLVIFVGSLLPYLQGLDSWLYDGTLDDPYEEMFFYANNAVAIDQPAFWEKSYLFRPWICRSSISGNNKSVTQDKKELRSKESIMSSSGRANEQNDMDLVVCPMFLKNIARAIVSAGKSLQLVRHVRDEYVSASDNGNGYERHNLGLNDSFASGRPLNNHIPQVRIGPECMSSPMCEDGKANNSFSNDYSGAHLSQAYHSLDMGGMGILTLSEVFLVSLVGLVCDGSHVCEYFTRVCPCSPEISQICKAYMDREKLERETGESVKMQTKCEKIWFKYLVEIVSQKNRQIDSEREFDINCTNRDANCFVDSKEVKDAVKFCALKWSLNDNDNMDLATMVQSFSPENPVITVCGDFLNKNTASWDKLNISRNFHLPPLNDENLREAIFGESLSDACLSIDHVNRDTISRLSGTDYTFGFKFGEFESFRLLDDAKTLETLYPFPTLLPCFQEKYPISALLPYQKNSTFASRILNWIQNIKLKAMPLPAVIVHECLVLYIRKQVDNVGKHILLRLMGDWRLMDELGVLRAIYLLGSGDLLQQFLIVIFDRLDRGESWDDEFELNTILQDSIRNSADGTLLSAPDSLTVSITKHDVSDNEEHGTSLVTTPHKVPSQSFGINALDQLKFTYKVSWPLDLIANMEAIKKYNQVMGFLLKVKRAKFVLDKARRWMWKGKGRMTRNSKHHMLVEQKLLHFVDAFHQYVMDRVFHSAWLELCNGMASAGSLDEVIEVHEAYLLSIQRQCFVAPDKLWALIASRIKSILGLALDFYSIQQTLSSGGAAPAIKARCEMEVDRIEKQFDDCIAFLLRILSFKLNLGHFPHLADLVTRINYNYFYMSDNGNLLTTPSFETGATKLGKTFPGKTS